MSKEMKKIIKTTIKEFLNNDISNLPNNLYHLTTYERYLQIKIDGGLLPEKSKQSKGENGIYLTDMISVAENYVNFYDNGTEVVLLEISTKNIDVNNLSPDDYELQDYINSGLHGSEEYTNWYEMGWEESLEYVNQIQYHKKIKISDIKIKNKWIH